MLIHRVSVYKKKLKKNIKKIAKYLDKKVQDVDESVPFGGRHDARAVHPGATATPAGGEERQRNLVENAGIIPGTGSVSLTRLLTHLLTHSFTRVLTRSCIHLRTHSLTYNLIIPGSVCYPIFRFIYHLHIVVQHDNEDSVHIRDIVHHLHDYEYG